MNSPGAAKSMSHHQHHATEAEKATRLAIEQFVAAMGRVRKAREVRCIDAVATAEAQAEIEWHNIGEGLSLLRNHLFVMAEIAGMAAELDGGDNGQ